MSLPVIICAYELLEALRGASNIAGIRKRFFVHVWPVAGAVIVTAVYVAFKTYGSADSQKSQPTAPSSPGDDFPKRINDS